MSNEAKAKELLDCGDGEYYPREFCEGIGCDHFDSEKKTCGHVLAIRGLFIPGLTLDAAREFLDQAVLMAGLVAACSDEDMAAQEKFMAQCNTLLATLPKAENRESNAG